MLAIAPHVVPPRWRPVAPPQQPPQVIPACWDVTPQQCSYNGLGSLDQEKKVEVWIEVEEDEHKVGEQHADNDYNDYDYEMDVGEQHADQDQDYEMVEVELEPEEEEEEEEDNNEAAIKMTYEVLQRYGYGCQGHPHHHQPGSSPPSRRSRRRHRQQPGSSPPSRRSRPPQNRRHRQQLGSSPPSRRSRNGNGKRCKNRAMAMGRHAKPDGKKVIRKLEVRKLRYSQLSCKETFQCGRSVRGLVEDLVSRRVDLSAPFLRLTVFETRDEETKETVYKCIDNRRLFALKSYANMIKQDSLMVHVDFYNENTILQVQRFQQNSDCTTGLEVQLRKNTGRSSKK